MKRLTAKIFLISLAIFFSGNTLAVHPAAGDPIPGKKADRYQDRIDMIGGTGDGFTLSQIRWGDHRTFERVVLEFTPPDWDEGSRLVPRSLLRTEDYPSRLMIRIPGATGINASVFTEKKPLSKSRLLNGLTVFDSCGASQVVSLEPARSLQFEVFTLSSPARIVVDMRLSRGIPPEAERYSLRTLPLLGDQQCVFLEEVAASGLTGRLLSDVSGRVIGEVGLFEDYRDAWDVKDKLSDLNRRFSLVVKRRGVMDTPAALP